MKTKRLIVVAVILAVLLAAAPLVGMAAEGTHTVTFKSFLSEDETVTVGDSEVIGLTGKIPANPFPFCLVFGGWYTQPAGGGKLWDLEKDPVTGDMTLYANWVVGFDLNAYILWLASQPVYAD